jgi:hypothetical protein
LRDGGIDTMQVTPRSMTHSESNGTDCTNPGAMAMYTGCSMWGESVMTYYMLAWFDRYLKGSADALVRLTASGTFDGSADAHSIGTGFYDPARATAGGSVEAGNVPVAIEGLPICNRLSFWYPTRYFLDGGLLQNQDVRSSCYDADLDGIANELDNCPNVANEDQLDRGGIDTTAPDGIGDACQCGDVSGNGIVNGQDANAIKRHGLGLEPNPIFAVPGNCDVSGNGECNGQDANAVKREALGGEPNPLFGQNCHNAVGATVPPDL